MGRPMALTLPLLPPPQKNRSPPSDSSPDTATPGEKALRLSPAANQTCCPVIGDPTHVIDARKGSILADDFGC